MKLNYLNKFEDSKCKIEISNNIPKKNCTTIVSN